MKKSFILAVTFMVFAGYAKAQDSTREQNPVIITTIYLPPMNEDPGFRVDSLFMYYVEKGIKPNPMFKSFRTLVHWWGDDNSKVLLIYEIDKFENINKAEEKTNELINASFKSDDEKKLFWQRYNKYFDHHEDNIMRDFGTPKM